MTMVTRSIRGGLVLMLLLNVISCGGNSNRVGAPAAVATAAAANVLPVVVDAGPTAGMPGVNTLFTTVTLCVPGSTTECQTIDHIQVDTGSYGLRVLAPALTLALKPSVAPDGNTLAECTQFVDGYSWGPIAPADIQLSGELASSVPIQVIGDPNFSAVPDDCSSMGTAEDTVAAFGANGILGIGVFEQDCGSICASDPSNGNYYSCPASGTCVGTMAPLNIQVPNPVSLFAVDNNGTLIDLPTAASPGEVTLTGSLIFGIDTQSNNASGSQIVLTVGTGDGDITTVYNGQTLDMSFVDSGSNAIYFNDSSIATCKTFTGFYCPAATLNNLSATLTGVNGVSATAGFSVANAAALVNDNPTFAVLPALGSTYTSSTDTFDFGLPFYYGRRVATAIEGHSTAVNTGPYIAF